MADQETRHVFDRMQSGDEEAARELFDRYLSRLVALARSRLSEKLERKVDADDIVQSAFRSFFIRARNGQFVIERAGDLWSLLASITRHKVLAKAEHFRQQKRNLERDRPLPHRESGDADLFAVDPTEQDAVALSDEVEFLLRGATPLKRHVLELRLQGQSIPEIAEAIQRSERTVRRLLGSFRDQLEQRLNQFSTGR